MLIALALKNLIFSVSTVVKATKTKINILIEWYECDVYWNNNFDQVTNALQAFNPFKNLSNRYNHNNSSIPTNNKIILLEVLAISLWAENRDFEENFKLESNSSMMSEKSSCGAEMGTFSKKCFFDEP